MDENRQPQFNIGHVVDQTGVPADTLRAWERRYGFPQPQRTRGGHRLYSLEDIQGIRWLTGEEAQGVTISRAVAQWQQRQARLAALVALEGTGGETRPLDELMAGWIEAVQAFDESSAEAIVDSAFHAYPADEVCEGLLGAGLAQLGEGWHSNEVTVQQEHFASALVLRRMDALLAECPPPAHAQKVVVACAPQEEHTYPALYLVWELRQLGFPVVYLGANVPAAHLLESVRKVNARVVLLSCSGLATAITLQQVAGRLTTQGVRVFYGGRPFVVAADMRRLVAGTFLGTKLRGAGLVVESGLGQPAAATKPPSRKRYANLDLELFTQDVQRLVGALATKDYPADMARVGAYWRDSLRAAAAYDSVAPIRYELDWARQLLEHRGIPRQAFDRYLSGFLVSCEGEFQAQFPTFTKDLTQVIETQVKE